MPKKTEEKNKKVTTTNSSKKTAAKKTTAKKSAAKKTATVKKPVEKVEVKKQEVVIKQETKKGNKKDSLLNNTPFVISVCVIILLVAALVLVLCTKRIPKTKDGNEIIAKINGKNFTANDLYAELKEEYGVTSLTNMIDKYIIEKEVEITKEDKKEVQEVVDYYVDYAEAYETDLATFLAQYVGLSNISTEEEFYDFVLDDFKKSKAVRNFIAEDADEDDLKKHYKENYSDKLTVKHILIEIDPEAEDAEDAKKDAYNKAVKLIKKLNDTDKKKLDDKFEELAKNNSDDTATYNNGGLIEDFGKNDMVSEFWDASYELKDGEYTKEPVKSEYGYHIILKVSSTPVEKFEDIIDDVKTSYAEAQLASDANLYTIKWDELRKKYKLEINDELIEKAYNDSIAQLTIESKNETEEK